MLWGGTCSQASTLDSDFTGQLPPIGIGNTTVLGRYHLRQLNWLCARWLPPSWGCAPSHLPPGGRYIRNLLREIVRGDSPLDTKIPRPLGRGITVYFWLAISFRASLRLKLARPFSSKPMNFTQVMSPGSARPPPSLPGGSPAWRCAPCRHGRGQSPRRRR